VPNVLTPMTPTFRRWRTTVTVQDIESTAPQYLGPTAPAISFEALAVTHNIDLGPGRRGGLRLLRHANI